MVNTSLFAIRGHHSRPLPGCVALSLTRSVCLMCCAFSSIRLPLCFLKMTVFFNLCRSGARAAGDAALSAAGRQVPAAGGAGNGVAAADVA